MLVVRRFGYFHDFILIKLIKTGLNLFIGERVRFCGLI